MLLLKDEEDIQQIIFDLLETINWKDMYKSTFYKDLINDVNSCICDLSETENDEEDSIFNGIINETLKIYYDIMNIPKREVKSKITNNSTNYIFSIQKILDQPVCVQKTKEWYEMRHNLLSASNIWKVLSTECNYNSLIYEKCLQKTIDSNYTINSNSTEGSLNWGLKYEKVSVMIYEDLYNTNINTSFGCIIHPKYNFIGASPDGIDLSNGRMVEIKNIVNREINGIPKDSYWIQTQIQMEVCDLDECDFFETRCKEYITEEEYNTGIHKYKGIILHFIDNGYNTSYEYMPLNNNTDWINNTITLAIVDGKILLKKTFWYLDEYSCVLIFRNSYWFELVFPDFKKIWEIILYERENGYKQICVIKLD
jgi:putative phage-type endonuclease